MAFRELLSQIAGQDGTRTMIVVSLSASFFRSLSRLFPDNFSKVQLRRPPLDHDHRAGGAGAGSIHKLGFCDDVGSVRLRRDGQSIFLSQ